MLDKMAALQLVARMFFLNVSTWFGLGCEAPSNVKAC
jgi:hypothetical protein